MAGYVTQPIMRFNEEHQVLEHKGYDILYRIGDSECPYESLAVLPRWFVGMEADFDEPVTAVAWEPARGLYVKPEEERGYDLRETSFYPELKRFMEMHNPIFAALIKAFMVDYPVRPRKECFLEIRDAVRGYQVAEMASQTELEQS